MRMDGTTRVVLSIDNETGSILLRRLHGMITNYNDLIIFLMKCNMDIKHIGSGEGAKSLIYYVTDYITKAPIPIHLGLAALLYALERSNTKYASVQDWTDQHNSSALTTTVNSMLCRTEVSHQQVMSYLVSGGDHYMNHRFRVLHYGSFEQHVKSYWSLDNPGDIQPRNDTVNSDDEDNVEGSVTLSFTNGSISAQSQYHNYTRHPAVWPFNNMGLYQFVGLTEKISVLSESLRISRQRDDTDDILTCPRVGRPTQDRGMFQYDHPQHSTHVARTRTSWVVPVLLGDRIARRDQGEDEREEWARTVLLLFTPWRTPADLKHPDETWFAAYLRVAGSIPLEHGSIITNMNILSECKDTCNRTRAERYA
ncbi:hypothetical protein C8Q80DRAFT_1065293, partial [Daedaleopsis nitida]